MDIRQIETESEYCIALAEIEKLFDACPGTPEGDQLEALVSSVELYEEQHYPIPEPAPIEIIKYFIESRGLNISSILEYVRDIINIQHPYQNNKQPQDFGSYQTSYSIPMLLENIKLFKDISYA